MNNGLGPQRGPSTPPRLETQHGGYSFEAATHRFFVVRESVSHKIMKCVYLMRLLNSETSDLSGREMPLVSRLAATDEGMEAARMSAPKFEAAVEAAQTALLERRAALAVPPKVPAPRDCFCGPMPPGLEPAPLLVAHCTLEGLVCVRCASDRRLRQARVGCPCCRR